MSKLYIYTRKDGYINDVKQNYDLIPKLFHNELIYKLRESPTDEDGLRLLNEILTDIKQQFREAHPNQELNKLNIYKFLLFKYESEILNKVKFSYINEDNKKYIINLMNMMIENHLLINSSDESEINHFITHLLRAHKNMEYGLYFSFKLADNDDDFYAKALTKETPNRDLIYFTEFIDIIQFVLKWKKIFKLDYTFSMNVLYANQGWQYGAISDDSIILNELDVNDFISKIFQNLNLLEVELICQLPLPYNLFRYMYIRNYIPFRNKYLKYKKKYLELKNNLKK